MRPRPTLREIHLLQDGLHHSRCRVNGADVLAWMLGQSVPEDIAHLILEEAKRAGSAPAKLRALYAPEVLAAFHAYRKVAREIEGEKYKPAKEQAECERLLLAYDAVYAAAVEKEGGR